MIVAMGPTIAANLIHLSCREIERLFHSCCAIIYWGVSGGNCACHAANSFFVILDIVLTSKSINSCWYSFLMPFSIKAGNSASAFCKSSFSVGSIIYYSLNDKLTCAEELSEFFR